MVDLIVIETEYVENYLDYGIKIKVSIQENGNNNGFSKVYYFYFFVCSDLKIYFTNMYYEEDIDIQFVFFLIDNTNLFDDF